MALANIYDYVSTATADNNVTMSLAPQGVLWEEGSKNQLVHLGDDGSEEIITLSSTNIFYVKLTWKNIPEADAGTIFDFFFSATKGNGIASSFKWGHPTDGYTYVVRFDSSMKRGIKGVQINEISEIKLRILGHV